MRTVHMTEWPPNCNPFQEDSFHMGVTVGINCTVMMANHSTELCKYLIVINTVTGERIRIEFGEEEKDANSNQ